MSDTTAEELFFFEGHEAAFTLYDSLKQKVFDRFPDAQTEVKKTQINFKNKRLFACVSFLRVIKKSELPNPFIVLTLGMPYPLDSERAVVKTEPYPGRWTTHIAIGSVDEIDGELLDWLSDAYIFADLK